MKRLVLLGVLSIGGAVVVASSVRADTMSTVEADFPYTHPMTGSYGGYGPSSGGHQGYDIFGAGTNAPIYAAHSGWAYAQTSTTSCNPTSGHDGGGRQVVVEHNGLSSGSNSVYTRYHHLSSYAIPTGTPVWVAQGDLLGYEGNSGESDCASQHLHLEFRKMPYGSGVYLQHTDLGVDSTITAHSPISFDGTWKVNASADSTVDFTRLCGQPGDVPVTGDWNGDGRDTLGYVRAIQSGASIQQYEWYLSDTIISASSSTQCTIHAGPFLWGEGLKHDRVVTGDWDSDGDDSPGVVRVDSTATPPPVNTLTVFILTNNKTAGAVHHAISWGSWPGRWPIVGDWNGDGIDTPGVFWVDQAEWRLTNSQASSGAPLSYTPFSWGQSNDIPLTGDWSVNTNDRPIVLQKWLNNYQQSLTWFRNSTLASSSNLNAFTYGSMSEYPYILNFDTDSLDEYAVVN